MEKVLYEGTSSLEDTPIAYVRMYFDDLALPCDSKKNTICPLAPFIESIADAVLINEEQLRDTCQLVEI